MEQTSKNEKRNTLVFDCDSKVFFTSDTHFGHVNILKFCSRPFDTIEEHDKALIDNWNSVVGPDDTIFHLGDFCFGNKQYWDKILDQLNGKIYLCLGNHDYKNWRKDKVYKFEDVQPQYYIQIGAQYIYLNHFPFLCFPNHHAWQLFGHVHSGPNSTSKDVERLINCFHNQYDVGVDNNDYKPISWKEILTKKMPNLQF